MKSLQKELLEQINEKDILKGMIEIDKALANEIVDENFCEQYHKLKKNIDLSNICKSSILPGLATGLTVSLSLQIEERVGILAYIITLGVGTSLCVFLAGKSIKQDNILKSYLLKKMEKKIEASVADKSNTEIFQQDEETFEDLPDQQTSDEDDSTPRLESTLADAIKRSDPTDGVSPDHEDLDKELEP